MKKTLSPDYIFETSWEICNKVGGINTVVATKALILVNEFGNNFILIGPDLWLETQGNPVFDEDKKLFKNWRKKALEEGIRIKIGRWKIPGNPIAFLIDFLSFVPQKNKIFKRFWEENRLDSISGQREYIEAAIFGYAAGKVIESFCKYNLTIRDKVIAHFHEWMSAAGVLYLNNKVPQIATLFTTHATVVGRSIAGNGMELYHKLKEYNGDSVARQLGVIAKHSLEKISAHTADCFTTVSEITSNECKQLLEKKTDVVTPNGFEDNFVPTGNKFEEGREKARKRMQHIAESLLGYKISEDAMFVANSGRFEFRNKGIDIFVQSMSNLNHNKDLQKEVIAFVLVPANNYGARKELIKKMNNPEISIEKSYLTHGLHDSDWDMILNEIKKSSLKNTVDEKVKIIYAPCYLDGNDGIFNLKYYEVLIGLDLTVFPSYYEPWGYTPLESLAFHVPTVTTNFAGIGMWVNDKLVDFNNGIEVYDRSAGEDNILIKHIVDRIVLCSYKSENEQHIARENAFDISRIALWKNLIKYYKEAFSIALNKVEERADKFIDLTQQGRSFAWGGSCNSGFNF
jgi:phosphorylase/glycogen(starch) synthase